MEILEIIMKTLAGAAGGAIGGIGVYFMGTRMINDFTDIEKANRLYKCAKCKKYARHYAMELAFWQVKLKGQDPQIENDVCPHCKAHSRMNRSSDNYPWLKTNPDCFRINLKQYFKNQRAIRQVKAGIEDLKSMKAFMEYHDLREVTPEVMKKMREEINEPMQTGEPWARKSGHDLIIHNYPNEHHDFLERNGLRYVRDHIEMEWLPVGRVSKPTPDMSEIEYKDLRMMNAKEAMEAAAVMNKAWHKVGVSIGADEENQSR